MRSVTLDRKSLGKPARAQGVRPSTRRDLPKVQPGSVRREKAPGFFGRMMPRFAFFADRPMMAMTGLSVVVALLAALFASGVIGRGFRAIDNGVSQTLAHAGFGISEIHITGNRRTPYKQILEVLAMQPGQSIFSADLFGARNRLARLDWIASAEVHRRYPDAIFVTLVEKRPFALWQAPMNARGEAPIALVERNGNVITTRDLEKFSRLPKLVEPDPG
jgi:cell division protein FtsQ